MSVDVHRTPEDRFEGLPDFPWEPHYREWEGLRLAHLDEGQGDHVFARDGTGMSLATPTWHAGVLPIYGIDRDDDGWGWIHETAPGCAPRDGDYVLRVGDCNDGDAGISPSAPEVPDGVDNDCDDEVDE